MAFAGDLVVRRDPARRLVRFAFCETEDLLHEAGRRLARVASGGLPGVGDCAG